ncbi:cleavage polyadenylation factor subunit fip1 [Puttea exsequens]|nr:cleavage polyadenylation factor subunit fip1 [Puttea exsequens]
MEEEDEDDMYAPDEGLGGDASTRVDRNDRIEEEEEGEEAEEDESDSDIDIITERKGDSKTEPAQPPRANALKIQAPDRKPSTDLLAAQRESPAIKNETAMKETATRPGSSYPAVKMSSIDVDAKPVYNPAGKPITDIDMDGDFAEDDRPWRRPGTDMTDYFNYGFDEFTWASYCLKQQTLRKEVTDSKKQMEEMQNFLSMPGGMPPMPSIQGSGTGGGSQSGMPSMPDFQNMPPEMQQMMQQMMQSMDPTQMDPSMMGMMLGGQGGAGDAGQNFGGQGYGQQGGQQQMNYGYGGGGGGGPRNQGGRGQGGRRW